LCPRYSVSAASLDALFRKARRRAGLEGFTFHDARGTALTRLSRLLGVLELARISGHRDLRTLMDHYYREAPEAVAARLR
jgi:integrase